MRWMKIRWQAGCSLHLPLLAIDAPEGVHRLCEMSVSRAHVAVVTSTYVHFVSPNQPSYVTHTAIPSHSCSFPRPPLSLPPLPRKLAVPEGSLERPVHQPRARSRGGLIWRRLRGCRFCFAERPFHQHTVSLAWRRDQPRFSLRLGSKIQPFPISSNGTHRDISTRGLTLIPVLSAFASAVNSRPVGRPSSTKARAS